MSTTADPQTDVSVIAENLLDQATSELALRDRDHPQGVRDAAGDFAAAIGDTIAAGRQLQADLRELRAKADLMPEHGALRLRAEAIEAAKATAADADNRAKRALESLEEALTDAALPRFDPARETLARQELGLALGNATPANMAGVLNSVILHGSREAAAAIFTGFGKTLIGSRGLDPRQLDEALKSARKMAAETAADRGETTRELIASKALAGLGKLGAVRAAAGSSTRKIR